MKSILTIAILVGCMSSYAQDFKYEISVAPEIQSFSPDQQVKMEISKIKGTLPTFQPGGEYLLTGKIESENPTDLTVYFGNSSLETNSVSEVEGYSQYHHPKEKASSFTVALKMEKEGKIHLSVYSQSRDQEEKKNNCVYKLILN